jgi:hypothetical protein
VTVFGGFAPFVATWLIAVTGDSLSPAFYLMATALLSIIALMVIEHRTRQTRGTLGKVGQSEVRFEALPSSDHRQ